jgi:hypothetical protein
MKLISDCFISSDEPEIITPFQMAKRCSGYEKWQTLTTEELWPFHIWGIRHLKHVKMSRLFKYCSWFATQPTIVYSVMKQLHTQFSQQYQNLPFVSSWNSLISVIISLQICFAVSLVDAPLNHTSYMYVWQVTMTLNTLHDRIKTLLKNILLKTQLQMYFQHEGAPTHFGRQVMQYVPWPMD